MANARNQVLAGDYEGRAIASSGDVVLISVGGFKTVKLNKKTVATYEVITDEHQKSAASGVVRGIVGGALLGAVGALAGVLTAKNKSLYHIAIQFNDGRRSLLEVDEKIFKAISTNCPIVFN